MTGLADHFGEDASLDKQTTADIAAFLTAFASERWDTEAANNLRQVSAADPMRITATPYWVSRHEGIPRDVFSQKAVGSKGNCIACHKDASSGRFDDQKIEPPTAKTANPQRRIQ